MIYSLNGKTPLIGKNVFIAPGAHVIGDVTLEEGVGIWFGAVLRGDICPITVKKGSNIQDNAVVHGEKDTPLVIGEDVTVGHGAIIHGCTVGNRCLVGMGAIILSGADIGDESLIAAGTLVPERVTIPPRSVVMGAPGKVVKALSEGWRTRLKESAEHYTLQAEIFLKTLTEVKS